MKRDKDDFADITTLLDLEDQIAYYCGIDELFPKEEGDTAIVKAGELIIVDESDCFVFDNPAKFKQLIAETCCICFTATPGDNAFENKILAALEFQRFDYTLE